MQSFVLSALHQVEYAVADLARAQRFFSQVFGECEVEASFSSVLTNPVLDISHAGFGRTVQQFCQPLMPGLPHYDALEQHGNCFHNLCYLVDDITAIAANCADAGIEPLIDFPLTDIWNASLGEENVDCNAQSYIFASEHALGFRLEVAETPWITEPDPAIMLPAYGPQWEALGVAGENTLLAINLVVPDLEKTRSALGAVFGENLKVECEPEDAADGLRTMKVTLGKVPMLYLQPSSAQASLAEFLAARGPGVHSLVAQVPDVERVRGALKEWRINASEPAAELLAGANQASGSQNRLQAHALSKVGVEFVLVER